MADMIHTWEVHDQCTPVIVAQFVRDVPGHVFINLGEVLYAYNMAQRSTLSYKVTYTATLTGT